MPEGRSRRPGTRVPRRPVSGHERSEAASRPNPGQQLGPLWFMPGDEHQALGEEAVWPGTEQHDRGVGRDRIWDDLDRRGCGAPGRVAIRGTIESGSDEAVRSARPDWKTPKSARPSLARSPALRGSPPVTASSATTVVTPTATPRDVSAVRPQRRNRFTPTIPSTRPHRRTTAGRRHPQAASSQVRGLSVPCRVSGRTRSCVLSPGRSAVHRRYGLLPLGG
jgi:hypothetical protein